VSKQGPLLVGLALLLVGAAAWLAFSGRERSVEPLAGQPGAEVAASTSTGRAASAPSPEPRVTLPEENAPERRVPEVPATGPAPIASAPLVFALTGRVRDAYAGEWVAGAEVTLSGRDQGATMPTAADGRFDFAGLEFAPTALVVRKDGYSPSYGARWSAEELARSSCAPARASPGASSARTAPPCPTRGSGSSTIIMGSATRARAGRRAGTSRC
jgi:hypothetical protein